MDDCNCKYCANIRARTQVSPSGSSDLLNAFEMLRGSIHMVANVLERDSEERPTRGEMAESLKNDFGVLAYFLRKQNII